MNLKSIFKLLLIPLIALTAVMAVSCSDEYDLPEGYGYVQFKLRKTADQAAKSRAAGDDRLDSMSEAYKMQVVLQSDGKTFTQTMLVESYNDAMAEYGLTSEKLELKAGTYTLIGYYLFNKKEEQILAGEPDQPQTFAVQDGGLTVQEVGVNALHRGRIRFTLTKDLSDFKSRATSQSRTYLFSSVGYVDVTIENQYSKVRTTYTNLPVKYKEVYSEKNGGAYTSAIGEIDTTVVADAGTYNIVYYATKTKTKSALGYGQVTDSDPAPIGSGFTVTDNQTDSVNVPVILHEADANIKDYIALHTIWEQLGGEKWSYHGESYTNGTNWNFNKDADMWGDQPGVVLNDAGRITALNIGDFNPQGDVPAELGDLTELTVLTLGTHNDLIGGVNPVESVKGNATTAQLKAIRNDYYERVLKTDPWAHFSDALKFGAELKGKLKKSRSNGGIRPKDVQPSDYTNGITSIPNEIGNLTKLQQLYIANGKIKSLPSTLANLTECRDVEVYNCKDIEDPEACLKVLAQMPNLEALNIAMNTKWTSNKIMAGLDALGKGPAGKTIQILYMGHNNLTNLPDGCKRMSKLGKLDCSYNKISGELNSLGKDIILVQLTMDHNLITKVPNDFCGLDDVETFSFAYNKITQFPNIFNAKSKYVMSSIDFSHNQISSFEGEANNTFKGINAQSIDLSYNQLTKFPGIILKTGSPVSQLTLAGNHISSFKNSDIASGENRYMLQSLDLSWNELNEFPSEFSAIKFPYFYGIDLSYNRYNKFVWEPLNSAYLTVYSMRYERDAKGNRTMREWPEGIYKHTGLRALYLGGNDIRKVPDTETISYLIYNLDISDNPNIYINLKDVCSYIKAGRYKLFYDKTQNIVGCDALDLN